MGGFWNAPTSTKQTLDGLHEMNLQVNVTRILCYHGYNDAVYFLNCCIVSVKTLYNFVPYQANAYNIS